MAKFLNRFTLPNRPFDPSSPPEADVWYNSTSQTIKYSTGNAVVDIKEGHNFADYRTGVWYHPQIGATATSTIVVSRSYTMPFGVPKAVTLSGIALEIASAFATTAGTLRVGLYYDAGGRLPGGKIVEFATVAASAGVKVFSASNTLTAGTYWVSAAIQGASGTAGTWRTITGFADFIGDTLATPSMSGNFNCYYQDSITSTLPATYGAPTGQVAGPHIAVRFSA